MSMRPLLFLAVVLPACSAQIEASGGARASADVGNEAAPSGAPTADGLTPALPVRCEGNDHMEIERALIVSADNAVEASGNCHVVIRESRIQSGAVALLATGNAHIEV